MTFEDLVSEYLDWCEANDLPHTKGAEDLLDDLKFKIQDADHDKIYQMNGQIIWLENFIKKWESFHGPY